MSSPIFNRLVQWPQQALDAAGKVGDFVQHPIQGLQTLFQPTPQPDPWHAQAVQDANQTFQQQPAQTGSMISARKGKQK